MLVIKLQRIGKRHQPSFRLVVAEKRSKLFGPPVADLGSYNPFTKKAALSHERLRHWLSHGARPTATVHNLLVRENLIEAPKVRITIRRKAREEAATPAPTPAPTGEATPVETAAQAEPSAPEQAPESAA